MYSNDLSISFSYHAKGMKKENFSSFWNEHKQKRVADEVRWKRSLFGAHLDDVAIAFQEKKARYFASRGQQKLVVLLIKIALAKKLEERNMLLLDDFLTDFDNESLADSLKIIATLSCQTFINCTLKSIIIDHYLNKEKKKKQDDIQVISLRNPD